jgi:hypothetical protein
MTQVQTLAEKTIRGPVRCVTQGPDPKSQAIFSKDLRIFARFGELLWLSEDLGFFLF